MARAHAILNTIPEGCIDYLNYKWIEPVDEGGNENTPLFLSPEQLAELDRVCAVISNSNGFDRKQLCLNIKTLYNIALK